MTCEFANTDREFKTQIVQNCLSHKLRMKALQNPDLTLTQLLDAGKAMEMSKTQAENIKDKQEINKMSGKYSKIIKNSQRSRKKQGRLVDRRSNYSTLRDQNNPPREKCVGIVGVVARDIHILEEKLPALLMENYVVGVGSKTTLKLYEDPKIPTRETSPRIKNVALKT